MNLFVLFVILVSVCYTERCYLVMRRNDGSVNFDQTYEDYVNGFGFEQGEYFMGLEELHSYTKKKSSLKLRMEFNGKEYYAIYDSFWVEGKEDSYKLHVGQYFGTAGDSLYDHNNAKFCTRDYAEDECAAFSCSLRNGGGWWYGDHLCGTSNLAGPFGISGGIRWASLTGHDKTLNFVEAKVCHEENDDFPDMTHASYETILTSNSIRGIFRNIPYDDSFSYAISPRNGLDITRLEQEFGDSQLYSGELDHVMMTFFDNPRFQVIEDGFDYGSFDVEFEFLLRDLVNDPGVIMLDTKQNSRRKTSVYAFSLNLQTYLPSNQPSGGIYWKTKYPNRRENVFTIYESLTHVADVVHSEFSDYFMKSSPVVQLTIAYNSSRTFDCLSHSNPDLVVKSVLHEDLHESEGRNGVMQTRVYFVPIVSNPFNSKNTFEGSTEVTFCLSSSDPTTSSHELEYFTASHKFRFRHSQMDTYPLLSLPSDFVLYTDEEMSLPMETLTSTMEKFYGILSSNKLGQEAEIENVRIVVSAWDADQQTHEWELVQGVDFYVLSDDRADGVHVITFEFHNIWRDQYFTKFVFVVDFDVAHHHRPDEIVKNVKVSTVLDSPVERIRDGGSEELGVRPAGMGVSVWGMTRVFAVGVGGILGAFTVAALLVIILVASLVCMWGCIKKYNPNKRKLESRLYQSLLKQYDIS